MTLFSNPAFIHQAGITVFIFWNIVLFFIGASVGSFLTVVADRWGSFSWVKGRSHCDHCGKKLGFISLLPVVSYFLLRRRCIACKCVIPFGYVICEVACGIGFMLIAPSLFYNPLLFFATLLFFCFLYVVARYDARHMLVLHELIIPLSVFAVVIRLLLLADAGLLAFIVPLVLNALFFIVPFFALWYFSKGTKIGLGDIYVFIPLAILFSFNQMLAVLCIASVIALIYVSAQAVITGKKITRQTKIPYVPYLAVASLLVLVFQFDILQVVTRVLG